VFFAAQPLKSKHIWRLRLKNLVVSTRIHTFAENLEKMTTISLTYNERNTIAKKALEFILSLGVFKTEEALNSTAKKKTLAAIKDVENGRNITHCNSFEDYLKAVAE